MLAKIMTLFFFTLVIIPIPMGYANDHHIAKFISVGDIHFNPFDGCHKTHKPCMIVTQLQNTNYAEWPAVFEQYGDKKIVSAYHDTNYPLLKAMLIELKNITKNQKIAFMMLMGDFLAHDFHNQYKKYSGDKSRQGYRAFVKKTLQFLTYEFVNTFPTMDKYPVIGNNDSYTGDYSSPPGSQFFQEITPIWSQLITDKMNRNRFISSFKDAGYYTVTVPTSKNHIITVLNTVLFTTRIQNKAMQHAALIQLQWLHHQLETVKKQNKKTLIAYHIPTGVDILATLAHFGNIKQMWGSVYTDTFDEDVNTFSHAITGILAAHMHIDTLQGISLKTFGDVSVDITPSISPIFGNNPAFKLYSYDINTLQIKKIETYFYSLHQKPNSSIWQNACGVKELHSLHHRAC